jgi:hypothetical protein
MSTFQTEYGMSLERTLATPPDNENTCRIFLNLLRALGKAKSRAKEFQVILRHSCLQDYVFYLPRHTDYLVGPALANLSTLFLDLGATQGPFMDLENQASECPAYYLRKFLAKSPKLEHLRLNFRSFRVTRANLNGANEFLSWLAKSTVSGGAYKVVPTASGLETPPPVELTLLRQLDIGMATVSPEMLLSLMQKFQASLCTISLHKVILLDHDSEKVTDKVNLWSKVFSEISKLSLKLTAMNLSLLSQELTDRKGPQYLSFNNSRDRKVRKWSGVDVQSGLRDIQADMEIDWKGYDTDGLKSNESGTEDSDGKSALLSLLLISTIGN